MTALRTFATRIHSLASSSRPRVALVTGASRGIGKAIALRLASDGYDVALTDLLSTQICYDLESLKDEIVNKIGRRALVVTGDVSVEEDVKGFVKGVESDFGGLDVVSLAFSPFSRGPMLTTINSDGRECWNMHYQALLETTTEDLDRILSINVRGTFLCYKYAAEQMIKQGRGGRIIGASSIAGKKGLPMRCAYSASKFAVHALTQTAAQEWAQHGITVNAYAPGPIQTKILEEVTGVSGLSLPTALGFHGTPEDVSSLVSFLASDAARYITGQAYTIDGGMIFE